MLHGCRENQEKELYKSDLLPKLLGTPSWGVGVEEKEGCVPSGCVCVCVGGGNADTQPAPVPTPAWLFPCVMLALHSATLPSFTLPSAPAPKGSFHFLEVKMTSPLQKE